MKLKLNYNNVLGFISEKALARIQPEVEHAYQTLVNQTGAGNDFLGWIEYANRFDKTEFMRIKAAAVRIQKECEVLVVIGIGGSYLGAKAVLEAFKNYFPLKKQLEIIFVGNTLSSVYTQELLDYVKTKEFAINVISKSGTTTEPAIAFRLFQQVLEQKYGAAAAQRIYATTDKAKGALRTLSDAKGYETFVVPDDIGGRYSWFTAVGLLPIACAGIDIDELMRGASTAYQECKDTPYPENAALKYAAMRQLLYREGRKIEIMVTYEPKLSYISEWWKQLYGESEGKDHKGIFPASLVYSTDLHSMGQFVQDGERLMFETVLHVVKPKADIVMGQQESDLDQLNYLEGITLSQVNQKAMQGTVLAHVDGGVPNMMIEMETIDEFHIGYLLYFYMFACGVSGYIEGVNPFNQPGVEDYKRNMFALLGKPGYEDLKKELEKRL